ncbi:hypothetical protein ACVWZR_007596 [Bradyrhizobium sp. i1.3.1]
MIVGGAKDTEAPGNGVGPFQPQARHLRRGQPRHVGRLEAAVVEIDAPPVPAWTVERLRKAADLLRAAALPVRRAVDCGLAGDESSNRATLVVAALLRHRGHAAGGQRPQHVIERHRLHGAARGRAVLGIAGIVTLRAVRCVERGAVLLRQCRRGAPDQQSRYGKTRLHGVLRYRRHATQKSRHTT